MIYLFRLKISKFLQFLKRFENFFRDFEVFRAQRFLDLIIFILDEAIDFINEREKPLAAYCFTTDKKEAGLTTTHRIYANFTNFMLIQYSISVCSILLWNCFG